jgi:hypothetical protein
VARAELHRVGVGMPVTQHPIHRSVHAELPHTDPALAVTIRRWFW